jgi:lysophospholipase L1-like esterase
MTKILTHPSITAHKPKILLVTPPPVHEIHLLENDLKKGYTALTRLQRVTAQYANVVCQLAVEYHEQNVVLVDLWTALMNEATTLTTGYVAGGGMLGSLEKGYSKGLGELLVDGLHLTGAGYKIFLKEVLPHVGKGWAEEPFDNPAWVFP